MPDGRLPLRSIGRNPGDAGRIEDLGDGSAQLLHEAVRLDIGAVGAEQTGADGADSTSGPAWSQEG